MSAMRLPDFVIISAMKAATNRLHMQLAAQPGLFMADPRAVASEMPLGWI